ncbi:hypothetical protein REPUB_Repub13aG0005200 [Reevesia pubescens]
MASLAMTLRNLTTDQFVLLEFKDRILDPHHVLSNNWTTSISVCDWFGVSCGVNHRRVISLDLPNMSLTGTIPPHLGNLSFLVYLDMNNNNFHGHLPKELGQLHRLRLIDLRSNNLNGKIPSWFGNLHKVETLRIGNNFTGTIPPTLGNMSNLQLLDLQGNQLFGSIPSIIYNISSLQKIGLTYNRLSGSLPDDLCHHLSKLEIFALSSNDFSGQIPSSIGQCSNLQILSLSINRFTGPIPRSIGNLTMMKKVYLGLNNLKEQTTHEWRFLSSLANCMNLRILDISQNPLNDILPNYIGNLSTSLLKFWANGCGLKGNIPLEIGNISNMIFLNLSNNELSGSIPMTIGGLRNIQVLDLSSNKLQGSIPENICGLKRLYKLELSFNKNLLMSDISSTIGGLKSLVSLDLSYNKLHGHIPESFGGLVSLEFLDVCNNNLSGVIPKSLEKLSILNYLNVSFNRLEGEIPSKGCFRNFSSRSFMKNYALCGPPRFLVPPCKINAIKGNSKRTALHVLKYALPTIAAFVVIIVLTIIYIRCRSRSTNLLVKEDLLTLKTWRRISHAELLQATDGFGESNFLGSGSFGSVYKGRLSDGMNVAIKVFNLQLEGAFRSFDIECEAMRNILHRNLVKVITCCSNPDFKALVLDFMSNGSLEKWLHFENYFLDILQRVDIMIDVASALEYLHAGQPTPIVHCDLKPSNILLDEDLAAHVGDFGIAKLLGEGDLMTQTMTLATIGYMAPEFGLAGFVSVKCDIYSYGILLIETFTKKKPTDEFFTDAMTMRHWVKRSLSSGMIDIVDANLLTREDEYFIVKANCISSIMELALVCSAELPEERKDMKDVVAMLKKIKQKFLNNIDQI